MDTAPFTHQCVQPSSILKVQLLASIFLILLPVKCPRQQLVLLAILHSLGTFFVPATQPPDDLNMQNTPSNPEPLTQTQTIQESLLAFLYTKDEPLVPQYVSWPKANRITEFSKQQADPT